MLSSFGGERVERVAKSFLSPLEGKRFATRYRLPVPFAPAEYLVASRQCCQHEIGQIDGFEKRQQVYGFIYVVAHSKIRRVLHQRQRTHYVHESGAHGIVVDTQVPDNR